MDYLAISNVINPPHSRVELCTGNLSEVCRTPPILKIEDITLDADVSAREVVSLTIQTVEMEIGHWPF